LKKLYFKTGIWLFAWALCAHASLTPSNNKPINGKVYDAVTGNPLAWVDIYIAELNRSASSAKDGCFKFADIPAGEFTVFISRVGYTSKHEHLLIQKDSSRVQLNIGLWPESYETETIVIEDHRNHSHLQEPDIDLSGKDLRRNLGETLAETIKDQPGLDQQTNGPAPARPVLRGLSGDRLLLLENGKRTGDLSATAADHAVTIDPLNAKRIEVVRGPAALAFGGNTLSGVINVIRQPSHLTQLDVINGQATLSGQSVNSAFISAVSVEIPYQNFQLYFDGGYRQTQNLHTPAGELKNTATNIINGSGNLFYRYDRFNFSVSGGLYHSSYGIPPSLPELGHINGIDIQLNKNHSEAKVEINNPLSFINKAYVLYDYTDYYHKEISRNNFVDAAFAVKTQHASFKVDFSDLKWFKNTEAGVWTKLRAFKAGGRTNTMDTDEKSYAAYAYTEMDFRPFLLSASVRLERKEVIPEKEDFDFRVGHIRKRIFQDWAASVKFEYGLTESWRVGAMAIKAFRAPGIEELFSDGPHLPSYAYEVGNANLEQENTLGIDLNIIYESNALFMKSSVYYNRIDGYLFTQNTGQRSWRRYDLFLYKMVGLDAVIKGFEYEIDFDITSALSLKLALSYLEGNLKENWIYTDPERQITDDEFTPYKTGIDEPLPFMPPLKGRLGLEYKRGKFSALYSARFAAKQNRPGRAEAVTAGYLVHDLNLEYIISSESLLQTIALSSSNIFNQTYRSHLNRIKEIFPEAGRNFKLLYKFYF
jgi:iron complex outermembrane receptor protein